MLPQACLNCFDASGNDVRTSKHAGHRLLGAAAAATPWLSPSLHDTKHWILARLQASQDDTIALQQAVASGKGPGSLTGTTDPAVRQGLEARTHIPGSSGTGGIGSGTTGTGGVGSGTGLGSGTGTGTGTGVGSGTGTGTGIGSGATSGIGGHK